MLGHLSFGVSDLDRAIAFYDAALGPLGALTHAAVDAFHSEALRASGTDNGRPGLRLHYGPTYYAAFVIDPDGYPIEAVCQQPTGG